jgi:nucleotide-binding universal stress UspA family protein
MENAGLLRSSPMFRINHILYSTDFSTFSTQAYFHAIALAEHHEAVLTICHCVPPNTENSLDYWREQLEQIRPQNAAIMLRHVLLEGDPAEKIVRYASDEGMNLIVMGTHGRNGEERTLMGSTAERVLREAPCSVLVIKMPQSQARTKPARPSALTV